MDVKLRAADAQFVEEQVAKGRYTSASDLLMEAIALLRESTSDDDQLAAALWDGLNSGVSDKTVDEIWAEVDAKHRARG